MKSDQKNLEGTKVERTGLVKSYLSTISNYNILTAEQEQEVFRRIKAGDEKAKDELINAHQRYLFSVAKRYCTRDKLMDIVQEANIGMIKAISQYDPSYGTRFLSFARYYIEREINTFLTNEDIMIRKSNNAKTVYRINKLKNEFFSKNGRYPSTDEMADMFKEKYNIEIKDKSDLYEVKMKSINRTFDDDDETAFENSALFTGRTASVNDAVIAASKEYNEDVVNRLLSCLDKRSQLVMRLSYGIGYDKAYLPQEISDLMDNALSDERIRQIKKSAIKKLQKVATCNLKVNN